MLYTVYSTTVLANLNISTFIIPTIILQTIPLFFRKLLQLALGSYAG